MNPVERLIYLACPYTSSDVGVRSARVAAVTKVTADLMQAGLMVFSPITHGHAIAEQHDLPRDWAYWERQCRTMVSRSNEIYVLIIDGWRESVGVGCEIDYAHELGLPVRKIDLDGRICGEILTQWRTAPFEQQDLDTKRVVFYNGIYTEP